MVGAQRGEALLGVRLELDPGALRLLRGGQAAVGDHVLQQVPVRLGGAADRVPQDVAEDGLLRPRRVAPPRPAELPPGVGGTSPVSSPCSTSTPESEPFSSNSHRRSTTAAGTSRARARACRRSAGRTGAAVGSSGDRGGVRSGGRGAQGPVGQVGHPLGVALVDPGAAHDQAPVDQGAQQVQGEVLVDVGAHLAALGGAAQDGGAVLAPWAPDRAATASASSGVRAASAVRSGRIRETTGSPSQRTTCCTRASRSPRREPVSGAGPAGTLSSATAASTISSLEGQRRYSALLPEPARRATDSIEARA